MLEQLEPYIRTATAAMSSIISHSQTTRISTLPTSLIRATDISLFQTIVFIDAFHLHLWWALHALAPREIPCQRLNLPLRPHRYRQRHRKCTCTRSRPLPICSPARRKVSEWNNDMRRAQYIFQENKIEKVAITYPINGAV